MSQVNSPSDSSEGLKAPQPNIKTQLLDADGNVCYYIGQPIGQCGFASCYKATLASNGQTLCCKAIWKPKQCYSYIEQWICSEFETLKKMNHPNVVKYHSSMQVEEYMYIFMELCPLGSLQQLLSHRKTLTEPETRFYMLQLLDTVEHFKEN
ncbi:Cell cycle serine/threonine-protein kinase cdc5/MSD2 [Entomophthora muscae]|uniref:Cell cycle serine/threonine-protein kinase cdc5/MSD2 n=1 Tax=Entomophthora muscae TaxID=34485 RepID=A0ACC2TZQ9_9FUNG|nr:Cell cycle serine/threonine-protein kinase cdc5/MSD2 [Entomophthora muscae]